MVLLDLLKTYILTIGNLPNFGEMNILVIFGKISTI